MLPNEISAPRVNTELSANTDDMPTKNISKSVGRKRFEPEIRAVSYTHLTLPTIYSV